MSIAWPYDPVELVEAIVMEVQETGISRTRSAPVCELLRASILTSWARYTRRLEPVSLTCAALSSEALVRLSTAHIERTFTDWAAANNKTSVTVSHPIHPA